MLVFEVHVVVGLYQLAELMTLYTVTSKSNHYAMAFSNMRVLSLDLHILQFNINNNTYSIYTKHTLSVHSPGTFKRAGLEQEEIFTRFVHRLTLI